MDRPKLYLFVGAPGAGKTTIAKLIHDNTGAPHIWADHERQAMFDAVTHSKQESDQLYTKLNQQTETLLQKGKSVIFDTNFNYLRDRDYLRAIADKHGAETILIWLTTPLTIARRRALHTDHRDRNRYESVMSEGEFNRLIDHLEPPTINEQSIKIDGSNIDIAAVTKQLGL